MRDEIQRVLFDEATIAARLDEMAAEITRDLRDRDLTVVAVLNGSVMFSADLLRRLAMPLRLECLSVSSYHGASSTGIVTFNQVRLPDVAGRFVLLLDDILDTGMTLHAVRDKLMKEAHPQAVKVCVLLRKDVPRPRELEADYVGFDVPNEFVVGYGLDYMERFRNLPFIGVLSSDAIARYAP